MPFIIKRKSLLLASIIYTITSHAPIRSLSIQKIYTALQTTFARHDILVSTSLLLFGTSALATATIFKTVFDNQESIIELAHILYHMPIDNREVATDKVNHFLTKFRAMNTHLSGPRADFAGALYCACYKAYYPCYTAHNRAIASETESVLFNEQEETELITCKKRIEEAFLTPELAYLQATTTECISTGSYTRLRRILTQYPYTIISWTCFFMYGMFMVVKTKEFFCKLKFLSEQP